MIALLKIVEVLWAGLEVMTLFAAVEKLREAKRTGNTDLRTKAIVSMSAVSLSFAVMGVFGVGWALALHFIIDVIAALLVDAFDYIKQLITGKRRLVESQSQ